MTFEDIDQFEVYVDKYVPTYTNALSNIGRLNRSVILLLEKSKTLEEFKQHFQEYLDKLADKILSASDILPDDKTLEQTWQICSSINRLDRVIKLLYLKSKCEVDPFTLITGVKYACSSGLTSNQVIDLLIYMKREGFYGKLNDSLTEIIETKGVEEHKQLVAYAPRPKQQNKIQQNKGQKMHNDFNNNNFQNAEFERGFRTAAEEFQRKLDEQTKLMAEQQKARKRFNNVMIGLTAAALGCCGYVAYRLLGGKTAAEEAVDAVVEAFRK